jgi:hypothetical protein
MQTEFNKGEIVLITDVDMYGFLGREYHPHESDVGLTAEVVKAERVTDEFLANAEADTLITYEVIKVLTFEPNPRFLDMIDFEIVKRTV